MSVLYIDAPRWPAHGRLWAHLISDVSVHELHVFAELLGAPRRGFERDHYDIPAERARVAVWLGAAPATSREIVARLVAAGLRRPRHLSDSPPKGRQTERPQTEQAAAEKVAAQTLRSGKA